MMQAAIIICANTEWRAALPHFPNAKVRPSRLGEWFEMKLKSPQTNGPIGLRAGKLREAGYQAVFFHSGWGKIAAAASAQYVIDRWSPQLLVNLGTCGGFRGEIERGEIVLAEKTIVYDIVEQMSDPEAAIRRYTTEIDLAWLPEPYPHPVRRTLIVSGDRDLIPDEVPALKEKFGALAGDWESGAIAWVAARNKTRCLILRGVSDLVGADGGEAYAGNRRVFEENAAGILKQLIEYLPAWIALETSHGQSP